MLFAEDNNGDEDSKPLVEVEEGRRGDSGEEEAVDKIGEDGEERSTSEGQEGEKEVDNTVWIHFDDFLELFRYICDTLLRTYVHTYTYVLYVAT